MTSAYLRISDIAQEIGVHVNTIRNYEAWGYLPEVPRGENGYRRYNTAVHLQQARLIPLTLNWPYLGSRTPLVDLIKSAARYDFGTALEKAYDYLTQIRVARASAEVAANFLEKYFGLQHQGGNKGTAFLFER